MPRHPPGYAVKRYSDVGPWRSPAGQHSRCRPRGRSLGGHRVPRLHEPGTVAPATRERVLAVAAELRYAPNRAARGLITGRTGNVGVIVPDLANPYFQAVLKGAQARARRADYAVFVADGHESATEEAALITAMGKQVDGIVLCSSRLAAAALGQLEPEPAVVLLNRRVAGRASVLIDSADGMRQAVTHLAALGHRHCVFVAGPRRSWSNQQRLQGLRAAAREHDMVIETVGPVTPQFEGGAHAAEAALATGATAVLAYNDLVALGILSRFSALGVPVPEQVSVVGFDDIPVASMVTPALTTVALPTAPAGEAAVDLLLAALGGTPPAQGSRTLPAQGPRTLPAQAPRTLPASLVVRATTAPPSPD